MKKEEKEELDRQKSSDKSLNRGIVAGAAGAAALGAGYAATHYDELMADDDESAEVIEDVDSADNEDGSFFGNMFARNDNSTGAAAGASGHAAEEYSDDPYHADEGHGHGGFNAADDGPSVSVVDDTPDVMSTPHEDANPGINADAVANEVIDDIPEPTFEEPDADAGADVSEPYDPSVDF